MASFDVYDKSRYDLRFSFSVLLIVGAVTVNEDETTQNILMRWLEQSG